VSKVQITEMMREAKGDKDYELLVEKEREMPEVLEAERAGEEVFGDDEEE
jgi:hypothetical protein